MKRIQVECRHISQVPRLALRPPLQPSIVNNGGCPPASVLGTGAPTAQAAAAALLRTLLLSLGRPPPTASLVWLGLGCCPSIRLYVRWALRIDLSPVYQPHSWFSALTVCWLERRTFVRTKQLLNRNDRGPGFPSFFMISLPLVCMPVISEVWGHSERGINMHHRFMWVGWSLRLIRSLRCVFLSPPSFQHLGTKQH